MGTTGDDDWTNEQPTRGLLRHRVQPVDDDGPWIVDSIELVDESYEEVVVGTAVDVQTNNSINNNDSDDDDDENYDAEPSSSSLPGSVQKTILPFCALTIGGVGGDDDDRPLLLQQQESGEDTTATGTKKNSDGDTNTLPRYDDKHCDDILADLNESATRRSVVQQNSSSSSLEEDDDTFDIVPVVPHTQKQLIGYDIDWRTVGIAMLIMCYKTYRYASE